MTDVYEMTNLEVAHSLIPFLHCSLGEIMDCQFMVLDARDATSGQDSQQDIGVLVMGSNHQTKIVLISDAAAHSSLVMIDPPLLLVGKLLPSNESEKWECLRLLLEWYQMPQAAWEYALRFELTVEDAQAVTTQMPNNGWQLMGPWQIVMTGGGTRWYATFMRPNRRMLP